MGVVGCVVVAAAKLWAWAEVLERESSAGTPVPLIPRSCRAPSQGAAPGIPGEGQSPWMTQGSCWHSPALSVPSAARSCPSEPVAALAQLQEGQV